MWFSQKKKKKSRPFCRTIAGWNLVIVCFNTEHFPTVLNAEHRHPLRNWMGLELTWPAVLWSGILVSLEKRKRMFTPFWPNTTEGDKEACKEENVPKERRYSKTLNVWTFQSKQFVHPRIIQLALAPKSVCICPCRLASCNFVLRTYDWQKPTKSLFTIFTCLFGTAEPAKSRLSVMAEDANTQ